MTKYRTAWAIAASTLAFVGTHAASAQDAPAVAEPAAAALPDTQDDIIVTGTRAVG